MTRRYVTTRHGQMHLTDTGAGPAIVLLASAGRTGRVFDGLADLLAPDFRVLRPDMLGTGMSDPIPDGGTIETFAETVIDTIDQLGIARAHVYGFNLGNKIATALAANWPDRVDHVFLAGQSHSLIPTRARRDTTIHGNVNANFPDSSVSDRENQLKLWSTAFKRVSDFWWDESLFALPYRPEAFEQVRLAAVDRVQSQTSVVGIYQAVLGYDLEEGMRRIQTKTLVIEAVTPAEDTHPGRQGETLLGIIPNASLVLIQEKDAPKHAVTLIDSYPIIARHIRAFTASP